MKTILPIVIAMLAVMVVLSGCVGSQVAPGTKIDSKDSFMSALNSGIELKCAVDINGMAATVYFTKDKYMAIANTPQQEKVYTIIDLTEKMIYIWSDIDVFTPEQLDAMQITAEPGKKIGAKMSVAEQPSEELTADDYEPDWICETSVEPIVVPSGYQFIDMTGMMSAQGTN